MIYDNEAKRITLPRGQLAGMYEALRDMGVQVEGGVNGEFASDPVVAQAFINGYTEADALAYEKARVSADIEAQAARLRDRIVAGVSAAEMSSWPIKRAEAIAFTASASALDAPLLHAEASARGIDLSTLVAMVNGKTAALMALEAQIAGNSGKHRDALDGLTTATAVGAYDYSEGWPAV